MTFNHAKIARGLLTCLVVSLMIGLRPAAAQTVEKPISPLPVAGGLVAGKVLDDGVKAWLGIPFAAPPIHDLRWKPPQPAKSWKGVYNADRLPPECIQPLRPITNNQYYGPLGTNEDCLYLNVWAAPMARPGDKLPVVVWIYGGGWTIGSGSIPLYDGAKIAARGAVFVTFNYRVGILGFMAHPELTGESPNHASGNYGFLDQIAALKWVQANIDKFGGDPNNVIIAGQSAGSMSVSLLQASPMAKGLFGGVVGMSGSMWGDGGDKTPNLADAEKIGLQVQDALKVKSLAQLRSAPADRLLALQEDCQLGCTSGNIRVGSVVVDGYFMPETPAKLFAAKRHSDVPAILGYTNDEGRNDLSSAKTVTEYTDAAQRLYGDKAAEFLKLYPVKTDADVKRAGHDAARDAFMGTMMRAWAMAQGRAGVAPVYMYDLAKIQPFNPAIEMADHPERIGAYHNSDTPYWFGTLEALTKYRPTRIWTDADWKLSEEMQESLMAFARTRNPNTTSVKWPAWTPRNEQMIVFDDAIRVEPLDPARQNFQMANPPKPSTQTAPTRARD